MPAVKSRFSIERQLEVFFSTTATSGAIAYSVSKGRARRLGPRLYTRSMVGLETDICRRNWAAIAAGYFPGAVISGRTAFTFKPAEDGSIFLTTTQARNLRLPGLRLRAQTGAGPQDGDMRFMGQELSMSSRARAFLENLKPSRSRGGAVSRTLSRTELEDALADFGRFDIESLNRLRAEARLIAPKLDCERELTMLDGLVGMLLRTREVPLVSHRARALATGTPFDARRNTVDLSG